MSDYKVLNATKSGEYAGKFGLMYKYLIQLEGVEGVVELSQKPETTIPAAGSTLTGTIEDTQWGKRFRKEKPAYSPSGAPQTRSEAAGGTSGRNESIERQSSLKAAIEIVRDRAPEPLSLEDYTALVIKTAGVLYLALPTLGEAPTKPKDVLPTVEQVDNIDKTLDADLDKIFGA